MHKTVQWHTEGRILV